MSIESKCQAYWIIRKTIEYSCAKYYWGYSDVRFIEKRYHEKVYIETYELELIPFNLVLELNEFR